MSAVSHCKGCGRHIIWVVMPNGAKMPVDLAPQVIEVDLDEHGVFNGKRANINPNVALAYGLNHFQNCPKADSFSHHKAAPAAEPSHPDVDHKTEAAGQ